MNVLIVAVCALGLLGALVPAVDHVMSTIAIWVFSVGGGAAALVILGKELRDWLWWMDNTSRPRPPPRPRRGRKRDDEREEVSQP